jgi:uncharacterized protein (UPF0332 family)
MPRVDLHEKILLYVGTSKRVELAALASGNKRYPMPIADLVKRSTADRLGLAAVHLRSGDDLLLNRVFRASIGRHYYAMYHAARAIAFGHYVGDDYERHTPLAKNLPPTLANRGALEIALSDARLLRNQADYDPYPMLDNDWEPDARQMAPTAASFVQTCEQFAIQNGLT